MTEKTSLLNPSGQLAPLPAGMDYFTYMLGGERLAVSPADLTRRFHEMSKQVHPDRFTTKGPEQRALSVAHAELLNQAYRTLKDPLERTKYLLQRHGVDSPAEKRVPVELAEEYFELQELAMEAQGGTPEERAALAERLQGIRANLDATRSKAQEQLDGLFATWDATPASEQATREALLQRFAKLIHDDNYARSMRRDIQEKFEV